ncbi:serine hydrolase domain-containing protein [Streptomyces sp. PA5.6]|uniref:serine hydrolase domain-containing protein n=1 Tax=Streptomyces sp. PA5.6 TaxID=3035651 RepID=UPI003904675D
MKARLRSAPGKEFHYSNVGYSLLAAIVEKVSGQTYERFLAEHLFRPAGMTRTGYVLPDWDRAQVAVEYDRHRRAQGRPMDHPWAPDGPYWNLRGNGGMLSAATKRKLFAPQVRVPELDGSYGYGWVVVDTDDGRVAWHDGGNDWSLATVAEYRRERIMVFWVSNHAYQKGKWNLEDGRLELSRGVAERVQRSG